MNAELFDQLAALIVEPLNMVQLLSVGTPLDGAPNTVDVSCHPGTPVVISFASTHLVLYCQSGATVGIDVVTGKLAPEKYLAEPFPSDDDDVVVRIPLFPFLEGPHDSSFHNDGLMDAMTLIYRSKDDGYDGIAAVIFEFHDSTMFALSAVHESHFCYAFDNYCRQLLNESAASPNHTLRTIRRNSDVAPMPVDSVLWMVD